MIGKGKAIGHTANAVEYAMGKLKAQELERNLVAGETPQEIAREFEAFQELNTRCSKNTFSFVVSPSPEDSKRLGEEDMKEITLEFMERIGMKDSQYISYLHKDKEHAHIHIFANRINMKGEAKSDKFIGKECQRITHQMSKERGMTIARDVMKENMKKAKEAALKDPFSEKVKEAHERAMASKPKNIEQYCNAMKTQGISAEAKIASNGKCVGMKFKAGADQIKGSAIGKAFTGASIEGAVLKAAQTITKQFKRNDIQKGF